MSITIIQTPHSFTPAYNEQIFLVSGTNTAYNSYKYVFNIYDSTGSTKLIPQSIKIPARPSDGWCLFDASRIIENYVNSDIAIQNPEGFTHNSNSYIGYKVKVGEEYDLGTSGVTTYADLATSSGTIYAFNGVIPFLEYKDYNANQYMCSGGALVTTFTKLLTTGGNLITGSVDGTYTFNGSLKTYRINRDENAWLYGMRNSVDNYCVAVFAGYNSSGTEIKSAYLTNATAATSANKHYRVPAGTRNIDLASLTFVIGSAPFIDSNVAYYDVFLTDATRFYWNSEAVRYIIQDTPSHVNKILYTGCDDRYTKYRLHFMNKYGGFDSFSFSLASKKTEDIQRKDYKKLWGTTTSNYSFNTYDRGTVNYNTSIVDKIQLNSDWITESEAAWLEELVSSPEIYWDNDNELVAVNIVNTTYEKKQRNTDKVFNLVIDITMAQNRYRQRF